MELRTGVLRARNVALSVAGRHWPAAEQNRERISAHWQMRHSEQPQFFNGQVHVLSGIKVDQDCCEGSFIETDFSSFLAWRDGVFVDDDVRDSFGSGLLFSADGGVLLGRQGAGQLNSGYSYPPGGFIDRRDVDQAGRIDIRASVAREIREETGISLANDRSDADVRIVSVERSLAFAIAWRLALSSDDLLRAVRCHIGAAADVELEDCVVVHSMAEASRHQLPEFTRLLLADVFDCEPRA